MPNAKLPENIDDQPVTTLIQVLLPASRELNRLFLSIGYNESGEIASETAESAFSYRIADNLLSLFQDGPKLLNSRLRLDEPHRFLLQERFSRKLWKRIDCQCRALCSSMQKMRVVFRLDDDLMKKSGSRMSNKDAREFCTRGISFLGRINGIANLLDELRRERGSSEEERAAKALEDLEEGWIWANKISATVSLVESSSSPQRRSPF
jgi:hypothetical protein